MKFTCPRCGAVSHNPNDEPNDYCARCRWWTGSPTLGRPDVIAQAEEAGIIQPVREQP